MQTIYDLRKDKSSQITGLKRLFPDAQTNTFTDNDINACIGCWNCWLKTPGSCVWQDQMTQHYPDYINSNKVVLLLDTAQGFIDNTAKAFFDRTIPHYLPYIRLEDKECHHDPRYDHYPDLYMHFNSEGLSIKETTIIEDYLYRMAYHFRSDAYRIMDDGSVQRLGHRVAQADSPHYETFSIPEHIVIYNGSPRLKNSNSSILIDQLTKGIRHARVEVRDLKQLENHEKWANQFTSEQHVLFLMPLYVHAMPSHVMKFMEMLQPSEGNIGFIVQSGFPESSQSHYLRPYFAELSKRLKRNYVGTIIKGGMEGIQYRPEKSLLGLYDNFQKIGESYDEKGVFPVEVTDSFAQPIYLSGKVRLLLSLARKLNITNYFWNKLLKGNQAYDQKYAQPYKLS